MAYDSRRQRVVLFGGVSSPPGPNQPQTFLGDTWTWDGERWHKAAEGGPRGRYAHGLVFDERAGVVLLYGGAAAHRDAPLADMWQWDGERWTELSAGSIVRLRVNLCGSPGNLVADLDGTTVLNQAIVGPFLAAVHAPSRPDDYLLVWSVLVSADKWKLQTEVQVDDAIPFRMRKSDASKSPLPKFAAVLRVR